MKTLLRSAVLALLVLGTFAGVSAKSSSLQGPLNIPAPPCICSGQ